jgi:CRP/FNR family transcriptional regulator, cyclic AMP receptor protein
LAKLPFRFSTKDIIAMPATTIDDGTREGEPFDYKRFGARYSGVTISKCTDRQIVFAQGDPANAIFYIISGSFKVTIISEHGKEAVISILGPGDFFGEGCLDGHLLQSSTISSTTAGEIVRFDRSTILQALKDDPVFSNLFLRFILDRNQKLQADLVDQLFNSSEKRLARILMTLASVGLNDRSSIITIPITQETLANMVGTTRSRINQFMTKFRKLGYIDYDDQIRVHNSLLNIILDSRPHDSEC